MATRRAPNENVIGLKRKNNRAFKAFCKRTLQNSNVKSPN